MMGQQETVRQVSLGQHHSWNIFATHILFFKNIFFSFPPAGIFALLLFSEILSSKKARKKETRKNKYLLESNTWEMETSSSENIKVLQ